MGESLIQKAKILGGNVWEKFTSTVSPKIKKEANKIVQDSKNDIAMSAVKAVGAGLTIFAVYSVVTGPSGGAMIRPKPVGTFDGFRIICRTYNEVHNSTYNYYKEVIPSGPKDC